MTARLRFYTSAEVPMKFQYLGTAAAEGFPATFCNCESCRAARKNLSLEWRTRSQAIIDDVLLIDFPCESSVHMMRYGIDLSAVRSLLVTHSHGDHFYAQELVNRGYKFASGIVSDRLEIYADSEVLDVYREGTRREMRDSVREKIGLHEVLPFQTFTADGYEIFSLPAVHMTTEKALLYAIRKDKTVLYLNDTGALQEDCYKFLAEQGVCADFVSLDCTFADTSGPHSFRHMGFAENCKVRDKLIEYGVAKTDTKYCVTHFSHNSAPFRERMEQKAKEYGFLSAHDGLVFHI